MREYLQTLRSDRPSDRPLKDFSLRLEPRGIGKYHMELSVTPHQSFAGLEIALSLDGGQLLTAPRDLQ
jgi:hypothetical protein